MQKIWKTILDGLTYKDLAGKRQLRAFAVLSLIVLLLLLLVGGFIILSRFRMMSSVEADPIPVSVTSEPEIEPGIVPPPTITASEPGCPKDPGQWSLAEPVVPQNYKIIQPACVYEGLERSVAWALAIRNGFSRAQATRALGFEEMPMKQLDQVMILADTGPLDVPVSFIPPDPEFTEWRLSASGKPSVTYGLRGCFRTSSIVGNRLETWGGDYAVICMVIEDAENTSVIYRLGEHIYTLPAIPTRSFLLFGYSGDGLWVWLGTQSDPKVEIDDRARFANDRLTIATLYDSQPWDMKWLQRRYGLEMQPPPANWQDRTDESVMQAILSGLNESIQGGG